MGLAHFFILLSYQQSPLRGLLQDIGHLGAAEWDDLRRGWGRFLLGAVHVLLAWGLWAGLEGHSREATPLLLAVASVLVHQAALGAPGWYYGVAVAEKPEGPYKKLPGHVFEAEGADAAGHWMLAEDPYIWFSRKYGNRYYAVARDVVGKFTGSSGGLALFESADGLQWKPAAQPKVLGNRFTWADGTPSNSNIERPALLFDGEEPVALFGATDGYKKNGRISCNVQIPLKAPPQP